MKPPSKMSLGITGAQPIAARLFAEQTERKEPLQVAVLVGGHLVFTGELESIVMSKINGSLDVNLQASDQLARVEEKVEERIARAAAEATKP